MKQENRLSFDKLWKRIQQHQTPTAKSMGICDVKYDNLPNFATSSSNCLSSTDTTRGFGQELQEMAQFTIK
jgi:hypothetical protein